MSFNFDLMSALMVLTVFVQLTIEVTVFGWDRNERLAHFSEWVGFVGERPKFNKVLNVLFWVVLSGWGVSMYNYPSETLFVTIFSMILACISAYFTVTKSHKFG